MNTAHVSSFVLISILRGQPRTPPSGDNLGVLDYHLNNVKAELVLGIFKGMHFKYVKECISNYTISMFLFVEQSMYHYFMGTA